MITMHYHAVLSGPCNYCMHSVCAADGDSYTRNRPDIAILYNIMYIYVHYHDIVVMLIIASYS